MIFQDRPNEPSCFLKSCPSLFLFLQSHEDQKHFFFKKEGKIALFRKDLETRGLCCTCKFLKLTAIIIMENQRPESHVNMLILGANEATTSLSLLRGII